MKTYSFALPVMLPSVLAAFQFVEIPDFLRGTEFRSFLSEFLIQITQGIIDTIIFALTNQAFGVGG